MQAIQTVDQAAGPVPDGHSHGSVGILSYLKEDHIARDYGSSKAKGSIQISPQYSSKLKF